MDFVCLFDENWDQVWIFITAIATVGLAIIGRRQLNDLNKTAKSDFLNKLKNEFFTKDSRALLILLETSSLYFNKETGIDNFGVFEIRISKELDKYLNQSFDPERKYYYTQEMDDFLLGHLEDAGLLLKTGRITIEDANQQFQYYVNTVYDNKQIQEYIQWAKEQAGDDDIYSGLKYIYEELNKHERKRQKNR